MLDVITQNKLEAASETLAEWLEASARGLEAPPIIEPITSEYHILHHVHYNPAVKELYLGYGEDKEIGGGGRQRAHCITLGVAKAGVDCIQRLSDTRFEMNVDGQRGSIRRGMRLHRQ